MTTDGGQDHQEGKPAVLRISEGAGGCCSTGKARPFENRLCRRLFLQRVPLDGMPDQVSYSAELCRCNPGLEARPCLSRVGFSRHGRGMALRGCEAVEVAAPDQAESDLRIGGFCSRPGR